MVAGGMGAFPPEWLLCCWFPFKTNQEESSPMHWEGEGGLGVVLNTASLWTSRGKRGCQVPSLPKVRQNGTL